MTGKSYSYKSKKRTLELVFENDSICRLENTFHCDDVDSEIQKITISCVYNRVEDVIYIQNLDCVNDNCEYDIWVNFPFQNSKPCSFLNEEHREKRQLRIGPNYSTEYHKYGLVPNIDIDTLYVIKNKIIFYKDVSHKSIGFVFK